MAQNTVSSLGGSSEVAQNDFINVLNIEHELVDALAPIQGMVLAISLNHFFELGIYDFLQNGDSTVDEISSKLSLEQKRLEGFLNYLNNENIIVKKGNVVSLTARARMFEQYKAWYTMLVGGYANTYLQIGDCMKGQGAWATRDVGKVGIGSCGISHYDAIPLTRKLMQHIDRPVENLLDIGCGNALYLIEFCKQVPNLKAYGIEPSSDACEDARKIAVQEGLQDRIHIINEDVDDFLNGDFDCSPDLLVLGFILQEILGQQGEPGVIKFLTSIIERFPDINLIVIEVDNQIENAAIMNHKLATAYYNPYYLLHYFTEQELQTDQWWQSIFEKCGLDIVAKDYPYDEVDSTRLELGYLLKRKRAN